MDVKNFVPLEMEKGFQQSITWKGSGKENSVKICGLSRETWDIPMEKNNNYWEKELNLNPGIYAFFFDVDGCYVHNPNMLTIKSKYDSVSYNVICIGYSMEIVSPIYEILDKLVTEDCCNEVDHFFNHFDKNNNLINLFFGGGFRRGIGTFMHWACLYNRKSVVSLLVSKKADLSLTLFRGGGGFRRFDNKTPRQIAEINKNNEIIIILNNAEKTAEREKAEREKAEREKAAREKAAREAERERAEREKAAREKAAREAAEREKIYQFLKQLKFDDTTISKIEKYGVRQVEDFHHFGKEDWDSLAIPSFQKNRIINNIAKPLNTDEGQTTQVGDEIIKWFQTIPLDEPHKQNYSSLFISSGFDFHALSLMKESDLNSPPLDTIPLGHRVKIWNAIRQLTKQSDSKPKEISHKSKELYKQAEEAQQTKVQTTSMTSVQERGNRREPPTARFAPGKRFLTLVPSASNHPNNVKDGLKKYAIDSHLSLMVLEDFEGKIEDFANTCTTIEEAFAMALCWLYTTDSWVYKEVNAKLRDDSPTMVALAPYMKALIESYKSLEGDETNFYSGIVYRRTRLTPTGFTFYKPDLNFVWSSFTSTAIDFNPNGEFGNILFEVTIPEKFKKYALCLEKVSAFPMEREVLLLPNIAYRVVAIENGPTDVYPNTTQVIKVVMEYVCLVI